MEIATTLQDAHPPRGCHASRKAIATVVRACVGLAVAVALPTQAADAPWPSRPVRIIVAQAPGGPPDLIARFIDEPLARALGVPVVVENRAGASGVIGVTAAAQAPHDGYTLLIGTLSTQVLAPHSGAGVTYDAIRDFAPVINLFRSIKVLWANAALPVASASEWIAYASARPGALNFASGGVGSSNHVDMALFNAANRLHVEHIPYNGPSAGIAAVAAGDAHVMIVSIGTGLPLAQGGRIRPLVIFADRPSTLLRGVPIAADQGLAQIDISAWIGLLAPAGTPQPVIERINSELTTILQSREALAWASAQGLEIIGGTPDAFAATLVADDHRWAETMRRLQPQAR
ncbi:MAG: tripartite tricarboxylate transporter substrate binding protein [Betaproteobacteria bacterium]